MLKLILIIMIFIIPASYTYSQNSQSKPDEIRIKPKQYKLYVGPYFGAKASVKTNVPTGFKTGVAMGFPDAGVSVVIPFFRDKIRGMQVNFGYESYSYISKPDKYATDANTVTENYSFFNISPALYVSGFILGLNIGIPVSASAQNFEGDSYNVLSRIVPPGTEMIDLISTNIEAKIGFNIPIINDKNGMLNFNIIGTYALTGYYDDPKTYKYAAEKSQYNPAPGGLHFGFSYLFKVNIE